MKKKIKYIYHKTDGKKFGVMFVGYNLLDLIKICMDVMTNYRIELEPDKIIDETLK